MFMQLSQTDLAAGQT